MDFLDSLDSTHTKSRRVRSWYLYEQYRTLEKNQLDAAQKLKNKSYQDRVLRQELSERRARRRLCDQFGACQSESKLENKIRITPSKAPMSVSSDDLFDSFCELHEEQEVEDAEDVYSHDGSQTSKHFDDFISVENTKHENNSCAQSVNSVVENIPLKDNLTENYLEELDIVKKNIAENINLQLQTVKEDIECLEKYVKLSDVDKYSDVGTAELFAEYEPENYLVKANNKFIPKYQNRFFGIWYKLVTFASKMVQLNQGNCYNDFSSQFLTTVLACDFLRKYVTRMCMYLYSMMPFISPVKYATSDSESCADSNTTIIRKKSAGSENKYKNFDINKKFINTRNCRSKKLRTCDRRYCSESIWRDHSKYSYENIINAHRHRGYSEPMCSVAKFTHEKKSTGKLNSRNSEKKLKENVCKFHRYKHVINPLLHVAQYIDNIIQDIE